MVRRLLLVGCVALGAPSLAAGEAVAAPAPCNGTPQITDVSGDGHHSNTDVLSAWFSEETGLQAVIEVRNAVWEPAHDDTEAAGFALLFEVGGQRRYVRVEAPRNAPLRYDYGTWTEAGGFQSAGTTQGAVVAGGRGTVTIDVPAATGATAGAVLARPFVLTYDGVTTEPHWVDRAPGGVTPAGAEYGADFVVGGCAASGPGGGGCGTDPGPDPGGGPGTTPGSGGEGGRTVTAVQLQAPRKRVGGGTVELSGRVLPGRAGIPVELTIGARTQTVRRLTTGPGGTFFVTLRLNETTQLRAVAEGLGSETKTITVVSKVRIRIRRLQDGAAVVEGRVSPRVPGRVLLLHTTSPRPVARTAARKGAFRIRLSRPRRGRYQAVFIPSGARAERSTSNTGVIR